MKNYIIHDLISGEIIQSGTCQDETFLNYAVPGKGLIEGVGDYFTHYINSFGLVIPYTELQIQAKINRPIGDYTWSNISFTWVDNRTLEKIKFDKNQEINIARLAANQGTFMFQGKVIACDPLSRSDIDGVNGIVALTGNLPNSFPNAWKAMDNTYVSIPNRETWTSFYGAMVNQGVVNFNHSQSLKAALALATTPEEVNAISW